MSRLLSVFVLIIFFALTSCSTNNGLTGNKPPKTLVQVGKKTYETKLGSYCWKTYGQIECADAAGPYELLQGKNPIEVIKGEIVTIKMNYEPKPNEVHLTQLKNDMNDGTEVVLENNRFRAPTIKGTYYYAYSVWWMDKKEKNVSNGDAAYAFALEVK